MLKAKLFALMYGDYPQMHRRLLEGFRHVPEHVEGQIHCNQVSPAGWDLIAELLPKHWTAGGGEENTPKYKVMRRMFEGLEADPETWLIWFDDDAWITGPQWWARFTAFIEAKKAEQPRYLGEAWYIHWRAGQMQYFRTRPWYRGQPPEMIRGRPGIHFAQGSHWWLRADTRALLDWPDPELSHNGGDTLLGEALRQNGIPFHKVKMAEFDIKLNDAKRRGLNEIPLGCSEQHVRI
jgi:hypothetical protein